ncbi:MAG: hypothetical protein LBB38_03575 [Puniceicoccales bacterium]|nr:hypothetical protein [Puniceicoccales bacterium]
MAIPTHIRPPVTLCIFPTSSQTAIPTPVRCGSPWTTFPVIFTKLNGTAIVAVNLPAGLQVFADGRKAFTNYTYRSLGLIPPTMPSIMLIEVRTERPLSKPSFREVFDLRVRTMKSFGAFRYVKNERKKLPLRSRSNPEIAAARALNKLIRSRSVASVEAMYF